MSDITHSHEQSCDDEQIPAEPNIPPENQDIEMIPVENSEALGSGMYINVLFHAPL